ncbi:MAG: type II toxin-antitoxin system RelE/ParE family toxin [Patescibacteria group bacterium]
MGVGFEIEYHQSVVKNDISKLSSEWKKKIRQTIEHKLSEEPEIYGKPLRGSLKGYWKLRVSDYRVIFRIEKRVVKIFLIQHRSVVYQAISKRMA